MELLFVCAILLGNGLMTAEEYAQILHPAFLNNPDSDFLLELEWNQADMKKTCSIIREYIAAHQNDWDEAVFGGLLCGKLEKLYRQATDLDEFGEKMYHLWKSLPFGLQQAEPFHIWCYAEEPLSWGDERQTREQYEASFRFFGENPA